MILISGPAFRPDLVKILKGKGIMVENTRLACKDTRKLDKSIQELPEDSWSVFRQLQVKSVGSRSNLIKLLLEFL